jgi:uncharacterized protein (UPF0333 family)
MMRDFLNEEKGQAGLEYVLLMGGIIMASVIIFSIYRNMAKSSADKMKDSSDGAASAMSSRISSEVLDL